MTCQPTLFKMPPPTAAPAHRRPAPVRPRRPAAYEAPRCARCDAPKRGRPTAVLALGQRDLFADADRGVAPPPYVCDPCRDAWFGLPLDRAWFQYERFGAVVGRPGWVWCEATYRKVLRCRPDVSVRGPSDDGRVWFEDLRPTFRSRAAFAVFRVELEYHQITAKLARAEARLLDARRIKAGALLHPLEHCGQRVHAACHAAIRARVDAFSDGGAVQAPTPCLYLKGAL